MPDPTFTAPPTAPSRSDPPATFVTRADAFVAWFQTLYTELVAFVVWINALIAEASANLNTIIAAAGFSGTSTTSNSIGTGSKTFTTQTARGFVPGSPIIVADTSDPATNYMFGLVTAYNSGTGALTFLPTIAMGSGTLSAWTITLSGPQGPAPALKGDAADLWAGTDDSDYITAKAVADANAPVASSVSGTVTLDFNAGQNFELTLTGNITLAVPTNMTDGDSGVIYFIQDATGSRTLSLSASIRKPGAAPTLSTAANAVDRIAYFVRGGVLEITAVEKAFA